MSSSNNNGGSQGTTSSTSNEQAHSENGSDAFPARDSSTALGTSPATSDIPDGKTRLFSDKQRQDFGGNESGTSSNYTTSNLSCPPAASSDPRAPDFSGYRYQRETIPDIEGWLQTFRPRNLRKSKTQDVFQAADMESTQPAPKVKTKQNPADTFAGELLQTQKNIQTSQGSRESQSYSKKKDSEDQTEDSKGSPSS